MNSPLSDVDLKFMNFALTLAATFPDSYRGKAVGAIIINADGELIGTGVRRTYKNDPNFEDKTPHAEFAAIQNAERAYPGTDFSKCTLYTTMEPCLERRQNPKWYPYPSCASVIIRNKIGRVVIGSADEHSSSNRVLEEAGVRVDFIPQDSILAQHCKSLTAMPIIPPGQEENLRAAGDPQAMGTISFAIGSELVPYKPALARVCIDMVIFNTALSHVLLVLRGEEPFMGKWCVPGGMVRDHEHIQMALMRKLQEETGITACEPRFIGAYSDICDDPRGWTVSLVHSVINQSDEKNIRPGEHEAEIKWFALTEPMPDMVLGFGALVQNVWNQELARRL
jgi:ADP-ribose pyrophosphatase YjhB (NUDIX family)/pyrimidine deaminase RibD-like protein